MSTQSNIVTYGMGHPGGLIPPYGYGNIFLEIITFLDEIRIKSGIDRLRIKAVRDYIRILSLI